MLSHVCTLIQAGLSGEPAQVEAYARALASELENSGKTKEATRVLRVLGDHTLQSPPVTLDAAPDGLLRFPFATSRMDNEAALRKLLYSGCEVYNEQWSDHRPHLVFGEIDEHGVMFHCNALAEKTPRFMFWPGFFRWLRVNSPISDLRLAPNPAQPRASAA